MAMIYNSRLNQYHETLKYGVTIYKYIRGNKTLYEVMVREKSLCIHYLLGPKDTIFGGFNIDRFFI